MPLLVPELIASGNQKTEWQNKLIGKKLHESTSDSSNFAKTDLPKDHRVLEPGAMATTDHNPNRLTVHVGNDGTVTNVDFK
ncbi:MAG: hypothetical protein M4579_000298 [Chaenotheca gracillima]|nr:MAG: hypothetical protein M4579_000298 [Chaenotheca gracillima]